MTPNIGRARRDRLYLEDDADLGVIQDRPIASIGYGSQGHAQAQNLRNSGLEVIVGNVEDDYAEKARRDGFKVVPIVEAVNRLVWFLRQVLERKVSMRHRLLLNSVKEKERTHGRHRHLPDDTVRRCG